jgi:hypothetical protein
VTTVPTPDVLQPVAVLAGTRLEFREGLLFGLHIDQVCMAFLTRCQGNRPLRTVLSETAGALQLDPARLGGALIPFIRCLIEQGFLLADAQGSGRS